MDKFIVIDLETTGLDPLNDAIHGVGVSWPDGRTEYTLGGPSKELLLWLKNPAAHVVGHNLRFDLKFLQVAGAEIRCQEWDTKIMAQLLNENQELGLKPLSEKYFGASSLDNKRRLDRAVSKIGGKSVADLCKADIESNYSLYAEVIGDYCIEDCVNTRNLFARLGQEFRDRYETWTRAGLSPTPLEYLTEEAMPLERVLRAMELRGIAVNVKHLKAYRDQLLKENEDYLQELNKLAKHFINEIEEKLYQEVLLTKKSERGRANVLRSSEKYGTAFNWQSSFDVAELIYNYFKADITGVDTTDSGRPSTSETAFLQVRKANQNNETLCRFLDIYALWKKNLKLLTTYTGEDKGLMSQIVAGRVHSDYLQAGHGRDSSQGGTVTGRLSSRNPNMQNLPRNSEIKRAFIPDAGQVFIYFDYSQLELRLAAHLSQDPLLIKAYREGLDLHQLTADAIGVDRQMGKTINFAMIYDASPWRLAEILQRSPEECKEVISNFYSVYQGYKNYLKTQQKNMCEHGWVASEAGRLRRLPELQTSEKFSREWKHAIKQGFNFPIQSLGASITKRTMIALHARGYELVTQVHDSVVIQVPKEQAETALKDIVQIAENIYPTRVPIKVDAKIITSLLESDKLEETNAKCSNNREDSSSTTRLA